MMKRMFERFLWFVIKNWATNKYWGKANKVWKAYNVLLGEVVKHDSSLLPETGGEFISRVFFLQILVLSCLVHLCTCAITHQVSMTATLAKAAQLPHWPWKNKLTRMQYLYFDYDRENMVLVPGSWWKKKDVMPYLCFDYDTVLVPGSWWKKSRPVEPNSRCPGPSGCAPGQKEHGWEVKPNAHRWKVKSNRNGFVPQPASPSKPRQPCQQRPLCCHMRAGLRREFVEVTPLYFGWSNQVSYLLWGWQQPLPWCGHRMVSPLIAIILLSFPEYILVFAFCYVSTFLLQVSFPASNLFNRQLSNSDVKW